MPDMIKDYAAALLGAIFLLISIITIPEIRRSRKYVILIMVGIIILGWLGIDKIIRDDKNNSKNEKRRFDDSATISNINLDIRDIKNSYKNDTSRFGDFKRKLETDFH